MGNKSTVDESATPPFAERAWPELVAAVIALVVALCLAMQWHEGQSGGTLETAAVSFAAEYSAGQQAFLQGDLEIAAHRFRSAIKLAPTHSHAANSLALVLTNQGKANEATKVLRLFRQHVRKVGETPTAFTAPHKLLHDIEQLRHLEGLGMPHSQSISTLESVLDELQQASAHHQAGLVKLSPSQSSRLFQVKQAAMHVPDQVRY